MEFCNKEETENEKSLFQLVEINGNLFDSSDSLCHCVSTDLKMGKGIAIEFKVCYFFFLFVIFL